MKKKTIAIDMDGVIADVEAHSLSLYERHSGISLSKQSIIGKNGDDVFPDGLWRHFAFQAGFFRDLPVIEGAVEALRKLSEDFEIYIVSAATEFPLSLPEKQAWLGEHFPFITWYNIVFCGDKSIINTDYMIDDMCKNLDFCPGKPLLFTAFHNHNVDHHERFDNWDSILEFFERELVK
ncbi:MAG: 5'(3')-deoxyribonucleotidase [Flavobacterium sp.]|uniref:5' nucleotidase, NT5C type n=1 Tax=Flavobacterium sp. TaxID=239 RepID=UPI00122666C1|nr:5'(3')-deoxyribonucleotidase [Flavobacterium sp.]RZJ68653.1 MAG: 5'(3')-deoxyribonucleotidase [Flavobacterium sp.]